MTKIDIEAIAREAGFQVMTMELNGCEPIKLVQAISSTTFRPELQRFAALLLEKAAQVCDAHVTIEGSTEDREAEQCAASIRQMAAGMGE